MVASSRTMTTTSEPAQWLDKPAWWREVESRLSVVFPMDLPEPPWALYTSTPGQSSNGLGGAYLTVHDNERFLEDLKREAGEGPDGPRGAVIMKDLSALRVVIDREKERRYGPAA